MGIQMIFLFPIAKKEILFWRYKKKSDKFFFFKFQVIRIYNREKRHVKARGVHQDGMNV